MADDRIMDIPFDRLRNREQRGIVCREVRIVNRGWRLKTAEEKLKKKYMTSLKE